MWNAIKDFAQGLLVFPEIRELPPKRRREYVRETHRILGLSLISISGYFVGASLMWVVLAMDAYNLSIGEGLIGIFLINIPCTILHIIAIRRALRYRKKMGDFPQST